MPLGSVIRYELTKVARHRRLYVARSLFGLVILGMITLKYASLYINPFFSGNRAQALSPQELAEFGHGIFLNLILVQGALVLGLTPALAGGAIADERQRKTLHYLLTSRLTGMEIIAGKVFARLIHIGVYLAIVLPVVSLLMLVGGIEPPVLLACYTAMFSTAFLLAALCTLISTVCRRSRDAISASYLVVFVWLVVFPSLPTLLSATPGIPQEISDALGALIESVADSNPISVMNRAFGIFAGTPTTDWALVGRMVAIQTILGMVFGLLAAWRLRPSFRSIEGRGQRMRRYVPRLFPRPPIGDNPLYWKEAFTSRNPGIMRILVRMFTAVLLGGLLLSLCYFGGLAILEGQREEFNLYTRVMTVVLLAFWLLALGSLSASTITSELEGETWISLLSTPLDHAEILRGKKLGVLRATAGFGVVLAVLWIAGILTGAVHPIAVGIVALEVSIYVWFALSLGTCTSLGSKTTWKAQAVTLGILISLNMCCTVPFPSPLWSVGLSLFGYDDAPYFLFTPRNDNDVYQAIFILGWFGLGLGAVRARGVPVERLVAGAARSAGGSPRPRRVQVKDEAGLGGTG